MSVLVPKKTSAAAITVSESVGCGWMVIAMSLARAAISTARTPSAISSPAPAPTMPTPSTRSLCGSRISLVIPSVRSRVIARPEAAQGNFATLILRLSLGEATPGNFGIGKNNRGNGTWLKCNFVTCDRFDCGAPFMRSLVRQHGLPGHVADGVDHRIIRLQLLVYLDEPAWADPRLSFFKPRNLGVRFASHGDQNLVENSFALLDLRPIEGDANSARFFLYRSDRSVQEDGFEALFHALVQRKNEIAVRARQQSRQHLNHRYLA